MIEQLAPALPERENHTEPPIGGGGPPLTLVIAYVVAMPFLVGIPRGLLLPLFRPSEVLQLGLTGAGVALALWAAAEGRRWQLRVRPLEWWLLAMTAAASVVPLLWLMARSQPVGPEELLAAFPFVKYAALYVLVRVCIRTEADVLAVSKAMVGTASVIAVIAIAQALGVGPLIDVLGRFFVSSADDVVDGGRGTTTIGSSIATGAYLAISCGLALSYGVASMRRSWLAVGCFLGVGALASGQAGTVLALGVVVLVVAYRHRRLAQLLALSIPAGALGLLALWPIVSARLADIDPGSGLPASWVIRWNNISELFLPSLLDGGWILGVSPNATVVPPDVWRDIVYLESGYLWLLWVGGVPLLGAVVGFLITAWRTLGPEAGPDGSALPTSAANTVEPVRIAAQAAVGMFAVLSLIDPHLTLRAGADLFFMLLALSMTTAPLAIPVGTSPARWRALLADGLDDQRYRGARLQLAEATGQAAALAQRHEPEMALSLIARHDGADIATAHLALRRHQFGLRGLLVAPADHGPVAGEDADARGLAWRAVVLAGRSLRLTELLVPDPESASGWRSIDNSELKLAAGLAEKLEIERVANQPRTDRTTTIFDRAGTTTTKANQSLADRSLPAIRFDVGLQPPRWKRSVDVGLGLLALVVTAPLWLATALLVKRSDDGPVLYRQVRIGSGGLPFQIYKFRTMYVDNDDTAHRQQNRSELLDGAEASKDEADPRITPIGRLLRRLSLDELPQLLNVLRSEMSLVGPRPSLIWESELFQPPTRRRLNARPGLTGLWQTSGRADVSMTEMLELDLDYVDSMSPLVDLRCLTKTATSVVAGRGAR